MSTREATRSPQWDRVARQRYEFAGWKCEGCGLEADWIRKHGGRYDAAHVLDRISYPERELDLDNLRALCFFPKRNHPQRKGSGFGCHNAMSGHWSPPSYGYIATQSVLRSRLRRPRMPRHKLPAFGALFTAGILWGMHLPGWGGLWPWGALAASLVLWPELGFASALWVALLALGIHSHRLHAPLTFGGYLGWLAALLGAWLACLGACTVGLGWLTRRHKR